EQSVLEVEQDADGRLGSVLVDCIRSMQAENFATDRHVVGHSHFDAAAVSPGAVGAVRVAGVQPTTTERGVDQDLRRGENADLAEDEGVITVEARVVVVAVELAFDTEQDRVGDGEVGTSHNTERTGRTATRNP